MGIREISYTCHTVNVLATGHRFWSIFPNKEDELYEKSLEGFDSYMNSCYIDSIYGKQFSPTNNCMDFSSFKIGKSIYNYIDITKTITIKQLSDLHRVKNAVDTFNNFYFGGLKNDKIIQNKTNNNPVFFVSAFPK